MKKCKYCNGTGTKPVKPMIDTSYGITVKQCKTVEQCPKCYGKGTK
jgi:hypothetical protein